MNQIESNENPCECGVSHRHSAWDRASISDLRVALATLDTAGVGGEDGEMPKVDDAHSIQQFALGNNFQADFDRWKAQVEQQGNGTLVITHEEVLSVGGTPMNLLIFWRIQPRPVVARGRRS